MSIGVVVGRFQVPSEKLDSLVRSIEPFETITQFYFSSQLIYLEQCVKKNV